MIVGAQKAGTSTLFNSLAQHPDLLGARTKEIRYFSRKENFQKGDQWYINNLKDLKKPFKSGLLFEATPEYLNHPEAAQRIYKFNKGTKIIIVVREPIKRAYSAWNMYGDFLVSRKHLPRVIDPAYYPNSNLAQEFYGNGEFPSFEEIIASEMKKIENNDNRSPAILRRGIYLPQIKRYLDLIGKEQVLTLGFKDLVTQNKTELNKILRFLNLPESDWQFLDSLGKKGKNARTYKKKINPEAKIKLEEFYKPHNDALFEYLGYELNW
ncbi:sulfotransferase domain-containing protein [Aequorivita marina]|uniref:sulfotransferase domain-containing protein n=1 Tax=Aequorivita marina TaxID=3073654 RepID=UPI00287581CC|nr:sulfotransferase domain-containing protein [Aequorivita sp. S2608]MDS1299076.1 sulfotransferase domain-containing protein [Aequorivita sp. S2608]